MNKDNLFEHLSKQLTVPLSGFGISAENVSAQISRNLKNPVGSTLARTNQVFGSEEEFMARYQNFEQLYKRSLAKELDSTALGAAQRRMIQAAIDAPVINLNLIQNTRERQQLLAVLRNDIISAEGLIKNFGAPGVGMPSSNLFRESFKYLVDQRKGKEHPALALLNSFTINVDPNKTGAEAFSYGATNLPSAASLSNMVLQSKELSAGRGMFRNSKTNESFYI